jgi:heat-inducible transcriptional repressor
MASELDQRKKQILKVITDDYIASAEPGGSRTIARKYNLGLSPATIRNEMADLEEGGYLEQPHTSAGRVPSDQGYRYYVDTLMSLYRLTDLDMDMIYNEMDRHHQGIDTVIHQTSKILAQMTKYPSLVLTTQTEESAFRHLQLIKLSENTAMVLIVTDSGYVENRIIEFDGALSDSELDRISVMLNQKLRGVSFRNLRSSLINDLRTELIFHQGVFNEAIKLLLESFSSQSGERIYVEGATKILEQPEFADLQKFKPLMRLLEEEERVYKLLTSNIKGGAQVRIGHENEGAEVSDCSVVTASYEIAGRTIGVIGVIGPTRMDYSKVLPLVEYTATMLSELLTQISKRNNR